MVDIGMGFIDLLNALKTGLGVRQSHGAIVTIEHQ